jgi:hypothetical protein
MADIGLAHTTIHAMAILPIPPVSACYQHLSSHQQLTISHDQHRSLRSDAEFNDAIGVGSTGASERA